ncbi:MAG: polymerase subunit gamma/tau, partial [Solirubrobacteraceae bacterium]|nr:polymerase subunit gamma/tau [Solirubrobacteraceae bacterium]
GPTTEPCGVCDSCVAIAGATSLDVIEMDAASNNSVDDIRDLRDSVAYAPVSGRHKVYILDEAHMLSPQAWNAFLKTLEEPPPHTIFVLATTEAQKVLATVVDRCHRFDFARPAVEDLAAVISRVAGQEDIDIGADAVALLARHATGSFRDALGTLEQLVTYSGRSVATEDVLAVLGVADGDLLFGALDAVAAHDARAALHAAARLAASGRDLSQVMRDVETHTRELLVVQTLGEVPTELHITPDRDARLAEQSTRIGRADLVRLLELLADAMRAVKDGAEARTRLELVLIEAASPQIDPSARALLARLERLEAALAGAAAATTPVAPAGTPAPTPAAPPAAAPPAAAPAGAVAPPAPAPAAPPADGAASPAGPTPAPAAPAPVTGAPTPSPAPSGPPTGAPGAPPPAAERPAVPDPAPAGAAPTASERPVAADPAFAGDRVAVAAVAVAAEGTGAGEPPAAPAPAPAAGVAPTLAGLTDVWPAVLDAVRADNQLLGAALSEARPVELRDHELVVAFGQADGFNRRIADSTVHRAVVEQAVRSLCGRPLRVCFELRQLHPEAGEDAVAPPSEDEIVARFVSEFDAREIVPDPDDQKEGEA